jgi:hypothetical protein
MDIVVAGFPSTGAVIGSSPEVYIGKVITDHGDIEDVAESDISSTPPHVSGGAVFCAIGEGDYLLGLHLGVHKVDSDENSQDTHPSLKITMDDVCEREPEIETEMESMVISAPLQKIIRYGDIHNVKHEHKGSASYFTTIGVIERLIDEKEEKKRVAALPRWKRPR